MKKLISMALAAMMCFGAYDQYETIKTEEILSEATAMIEVYDVNGDGVLSEDEQLAFVEDLYVGNGGDKATKQELELAVDEAISMLNGFDTDNDGDLSYEERLSIVQAVYEKYDNGEITDELFRKFLEGYENKVNDLNAYHDLLDEVGVPGANIQIELRSDK